MQHVQSSHRSNTKPKSDTSPSQRITSSDTYKTHTLHLSLELHLSLVMSSSVGVLPSFPLQSSVSPPPSSSVTNLSAFLPFLITGNIRLAHRYHAPPLVDAWIRNTSVRRSTPSSPSIASIGEIILGELHPVPGRETKIIDHTGMVHVIPPSHTPTPIRVLAALGHRESSLHCNGGLFDSSGAPASSIALTSGSVLTWLGEPSGIVGQLLADAPRRVMHAWEETSQPTAAAPSHTTTHIEFVPHACKFVVIGAVYDASSGQPLHIRSLSPLPPASIPNSIHTPTSAPSSSSHSPPLRALPKLVLVGSTSSSAGKTSLACALALTLHRSHSLHHRPLINYLKFTGSGSFHDTQELRRLQVPSTTAPSGEDASIGNYPAIVRAYDHVDFGHITTYGGGGGGGGGCTTERFRRMVDEMLTLASMPVITPSTGHQQQIDYIICELGSDLIWAHNPLLLTMPIILSNLHGLFVLTSDALSILGVCNFLHGTLQLPPERLILIHSYLQSYNFRGILQRCKGSHVHVYQMIQQDLEEGMRLLKQRDQEEQEQEQAQEEEEQNERTLDDAPTTRGDVVEVTDSLKNIEVATPNNVDSRFQLTLPLLTFPDTLPSPTECTCSEELMRWVLECNRVATEGVTTPSPDNTAVTATAAVSASSLVDFDYDSSDITVLIGAITKDDALQRALNFQFLLRKRDRLRAKRQKEMEATNTATTTATSTTTTLPPSQSSTVDHLLQLGDYRASPYAFPSCPLPPPDSLGGALLDSDSSLSWLRRTFVPARVSEDTFWMTYFDALYQGINTYIQRRTQVRT